MKTDILIQNVSAQCIPNLVAVKTFRPRKLIWVYTPEFGDVLNRLRTSTADLVAVQENWRVDARDAEGMHAAMHNYFQTLSADKRILYHLTGGTKSMAIQGQMQLHASTAEAEGVRHSVVMDPRTQCFDQLYPHPVNHAFPCQMLTLDDILKVHGNGVHRLGRSLNELRHMFDGLERLRLISVALTRTIRDTATVIRRQDGSYAMTKGQQIPAVIRQALEITADIGVLEHLTVSDRSFRCDTVRTGDLVAYMRNLWLEDWVGALLATHIDDWQGGFSGVHVRIGKPGRTGLDKQEFDFLGARQNHLIYWSCKNVKEIKPAYLFEVDALRDEVGGRDFHVAGLLYAGAMGEGMQKKAVRLGVGCVNVLEPDAAEQVVKISGT